MNEASREEVSSREMVASWQTELKEAIRGLDMDRFDKGTAVATGNILRAGLDLREEERNVFAVTAASLLEEKYRESIDSIERLAGLKENKKNRQDDLDRVKRMKEQREFVVNMLKSAFSQEKK